MIKKNCTVCGKIFYVGRSCGINNCVRTCSKQCYDISRKGNRNCNYKGGKITKECLICGKPFDVFQYRKDTAIYCSKSCHSTATVLSKTDGHRGKNKKDTLIERIVAKILDSMSIQYVKQHRVGPYYCDFYLPLYNTVIECDGVYWHTSPNAIIRDDKKNKCIFANDIRLLRLLEDEIIEGEAQKIISSFLFE